MTAYTRASEDGGIPEAQYKLGFFYGSNYGGAMGGAEGVGAQGSVSPSLPFFVLPLTRFVRHSCTTPLRRCRHMSLRP